MEVLRTAILEMLRQKKGKSFNSAEVVKQMYPEDWEQFLGDVNKVVIELSEEGLLRVDNSDLNLINSLTISSPSKL